GQGCAVQFVGTRAVERQKLGAGGVVKGGGMVRQHAAARAGKIGQHSIDAVERGARHQADVKLGHRFARGPRCQEEAPRRCCAYSALACCMDSADASSMRIIAAKRSNAGRAAADTGVAASLWRAMVMGSWCWPLTRNSKCRCGPVAQPVEPTAP